MTELLSAGSAPKLALTVYLLVSDDKDALLIANP